MLPTANGRWDGLNSKGDLLDGYLHWDLEPQAAPLVVDGDDLSFDCLSGSVAIFLDKVAAAPPFMVHRILAWFDTNNRPLDGLGAVLKR